MALVVAVAATIAAGAGAPGGAAQAPTVDLRSEQQLPPVYAQGIAGYGTGWILSGRSVLARVDRRLRVRRQRTNVIPRDWAGQGYNHVGDVDVVGRCLYAPWEQGDYTKGFQVMARYDAKTLRLVDQVPVGQHENSFVTVDPKTMVAYSMDGFDGSELLRYDVSKGRWDPLDPLVMDATLQHVQGADVAGGAAWLSTSDPRNDLYRVDLETGHVDALGSSGHVPGEGEGIDATKTKAGVLHTLTVDPALTPVWLGHFGVDGTKIAKAGDGSAKCRPTT